MKYWNLLGREVFSVLECLATEYTLLSTWLQLSCLQYSNNTDIVMINALLMHMHLLGALDLYLALYALDNSWFLQM